MNLKQLELFVSAMRYRSINRVADVRGLKHGVVRYNLQRMSEITGEELFKQERYGILVPTSYARRLEQLCKEMLKIWASLAETAGEEAESPLDAPTGSAELPAMADAISWTCRAAGPSVSQAMAHTEQHAGETTSDAC